MVIKNNIIIIVSDTLRQLSPGCYGSKGIKTPIIDSFVAESIIFNETYPELLPTIPARRLNAHYCRDAGKADAIGG